ncbi:hypothetical protein G7068_13740 [Leucobacter viscericola]|uniref:Uncharacterized protein n=1 Tax=Leucobacter viscericola TaxID=2714935 RepID=A0A6G7XIE4_9MICO|nr:hypothetical protein [Leucobacter viscericola]QIK64141.1 hypothetical protein G7068_13740 [Leucobacter viscericola]
MRTRQVVRSTISTPDGEVQLSDAFADATDAAAALPGQREVLAALDAAQSSDFDLIGEAITEQEALADGLHETQMSVIGTNLVVQAAQEQAEEAIRAASEVSEFAEGVKAVADAAANDAEAAKTTANSAQREAKDAAQAAIDRAADAELAAKEFAKAQAEQAQIDANDETGRAVAAAKVAAAKDAQDKADEAERAAKEKAAEAKLAADSAAQAAATADAKAVQAREDALRAARYRVGPDGVYSPAMPEGGFRIGAQLVRVNADGHPYRIDRWAGAEWVRDQVLMDQLLIPSEDGTIAIGNAQIYAPTIIGGEFFGNRFEGSTFTLPSVEASETVLTDQCESVGQWVGPWDPIPKPTLSTAQKRSGNYSLLLSKNPSTTERGAKRPIPTTSFPRGGYFSVWVWRSVAGSMLVTDEAQVYGGYDMPAKTWVEIRCAIPSGVSVSQIRVSDAGAGAALIYIDDLTVVRYTSLSGKAAIDRAPSGAARVYSEAADGSMIKFQDSQLEADYGGLSGFVRPHLFGASAISVEMGVSSTQADTRSELRLDAGGSLLSIVAVRDDTLIGRFRFDGDGVITVQDTIRSRIDTDWQNVAIPGGTGTCRWMRKLGIIYLEFDVKYTASVAANGVLAPAFTLPAAAYPPLNKPISVVGGGSVPGLGWVDSATGRCTIRNLHTAASTSFLGHGSWPASS